MATSSPSYDFLSYARISRETSIRALRCKLLLSQGAGMEAQGGSVGAGGATSSACSSFPSHHLTFGSVVPIQSLCWAASFADQGNSMSETPQRGCIANTLYAQPGNSRKSYAFQARLIEEC